MTGRRPVALRLRVVLDANVLLQAPIRDTLLRAAEADLFLPHWSSSILAEVECHFPDLVGRRVDASRRATYLIERLNAAFPNALVEVDDATLPPLTNHPGDRHVLATAIHARADMIVTFNLRHFPAAALAPHGVVAVTPDRLLTQLFARWPAVLLDVLARQGADLNPPRTVEAVLTALEATAPDFVAIVRLARNGG